VALEVAAGNRDDVAHSLGCCQAPTSVEVILPEIIRVLPSLFDTICFQGQKAMAEIHNLRQNADDLWYLLSDNLI